MSWLFYKNRFASILIGAAFLGAWAGHLAWGATITSAGTGNWSATAWPNTARTGTITTATNSKNVTGSGTAFTTELTIGNIVKTTGNVAIGTVSAITDDTHLTFVANAASANSSVAYHSQGVGPVDVVTIASGHTITMDVVSTTVNKLTLASPTAANNLNLTTGHTLNVTGALTFTANAAANAQTITLNGTANLNAGSIVSVASTGKGASIITCAAGATGSLTVTGDMAIVGSGVTGSAGSKVDFGTTVTACNVTAGTVHLTGGSVGAGLLKMGTGTLTFNGALTMAGTATKAQLTTAGAADIVMNGMTLGTGGTISIAAGTSLTTSGTSAITYATSINTWGPLEVTNGTFTYGGAAGTVTDMTIDNGATLSNSVTLTASGDYLNNGTHSGTGALTLTGSGTTVDGTGTNSKTGLVTLTNDKTILNSADLALAGALTVSASTVITQNGTLSVTGTLTVTGTMNNNGAVTAVGSLTGGGAWTQGANSTLIAAGATTTAMAVTTVDFATNDNTVDYNRAGNQTCKPAAYSTLEIDGSGTKTMTSITTVSGDFLGNGGSGTAPLTSVGGDILIDGATVTLGGALEVSGKVTVNTGSLTTGAFALNVDSTTEVAGGTLSLTSNTGAKTLSGPVTVDGGTLSGASTNIIFEGGLTQTSGSVSITGTAGFNTNDQALNGTLSIAAITVGSGVTLTNNASVTDSGAVTVSGSILNNGTFDVNGNLTGGGSWTQESGSVLHAGGATTNAMAVNTVDFSSNDNSVYYDRAGSQTCNPADYDDLQLAGSGAKTITGISAVSGDLTLSGTATATTGANLVIGGSLVISAGTFTTGNFTLDVASMTDIEGAFTHSGNSAVTLEGDVTMNGTLSGNGVGSIFAFGEVTGDGTVNLANNAFEQRVAANHNFGQLSGTNVWSFNDLTFSNSHGTGVPVQITMESGGSGGVNVDGTLTVGRSTDTPGATTTLDPGNAVWTLTGTGAVFTLMPGFGFLCPTSSCADNISVFQYLGNNTTTVTGTNGYYDLQLIPTITANRAYASDGVLSAAHSILINPAAASGNRLLTFTLGGDLSAAGGLTLEGTTNGCSALNTSGSSYNITASSIAILSGQNACTNNLIANASQITLSDTALPFSVGPTLASFTFGTSTVTFTGNGAAIAPVNYFNLILAPSGAPQVLGLGEIDIDGDLTVTGPLSTVGSTIAFTGSSAQHADTGEQSLDVIIDSNTNAGGVTFTSDLTASRLVANAATLGNNVRLFFNAGSTFTITTLILTGDSGDIVRLRSTDAPTYWYLAAQNATVAYVNVQDSNAGSGHAIVPSNSIDSGHNVNWFFGPAAVTDLGATPETDGSVLLSWTAPLDSNYNPLPTGSRYAMEWSTYNILASTSNAGDTGYLLTHHVYIDTVNVNAGDAQIYVSTGLTGNVTYYFTLWTQDPASIWSAPSNSTSTPIIPVLSFRYSESAYKFGLVNLGATTVSTSAIVITNIGNVQTSYALAVTTKGVTSTWNVGIATPTVLDVFALFGTFNPAEPSIDDFGPEDIIVGTPTFSNANVYSTGLENGMQVDPGDDLHLWFRLDMPPLTTSAGEQQMSVIIAADTP